MKPQSKDIIATKDRDNEGEDDEDEDDEDMADTPSSSVIPISHEITLNEHSKVNLTDNSSHGITQHGINMNIQSHLPRFNDRRSLLWLSIPQEQDLSQEDMTSMSVFGTLREWIHDSDPSDPWSHAEHIRFTNSSTL